MTPEEIALKIQEVQQLIEQVRAETQKGGNTKERVANLLTKINDILALINENSSGGADIPAGTERQVLGYSSIGTPEAVRLGWKQLSDLPSPPAFSNGVLTGTAFQPDGTALFAFTKLAIDAPEASTIPFYQPDGKLLVANGTSGNEATNFNQLNNKIDKIASPNNTSERVINGDGTTTAKSDFESTKYVAVTLPATALEAWKGLIVYFSGSGSLTIPNTLSDGWTINGITELSATISLSLASGKTWRFGTPEAIPEKQIFTITQRVNNIYLLGV